MNKIIITVQGYLLYPDKYTKEQLEENLNIARSSTVCAAPYGENAIRAYESRIAAYDAANAAVSFAKKAVMRENFINNAIHIGYGPVFTGNTEVKKYVSKYFELTGENRQDYIDAINGGEL